MSLRDVNYKEVYVSGVDNLVKDFYIPSLEQSVLYQRRTGYFNSRALAMAARGLSGLLRNNGKMELLCGVQMDKEEAEVIRDPVSYLERRAIDVLKALEQPYDELEKQRLGLLAHLLSTGKLEIKIGYRKGGIYHEKAGIFRDAEGNIVAFNGSGNETPGGWLNNTESFHAFTSWQDDRHIRPEIETFERLWNNRDTKTTVIPLPYAVVRGIIEFKDYFEAGMDEPIDPMDIQTQVDIPDWKWTPQLAYIFEAPRLWNHHDFAYAQTAITPYEHQDYIASTVLNSWPPRYLFADEVGLGKTIEAGLVIKGFKAAGRIERLLILAPKNVMPQWQEELYTKFGFEAWRLDGDHVYPPHLDPSQPRDKERVDAANPFRSKHHLIVSSQLIRSEERLAQALGLEYDLVILDEAHHARASGSGGRREPNKLLQAMEQLRYHTQGLIMMTATPIQLSRMDLWDLLSILELPGKWQDRHLFDRFFADINAPDVDWAFLLDMVQSSLQLMDFDENEEAHRLQEDYPEVDVYRLIHIVKENEVSAIRDLSEKEQEALKVLLYRFTPVRQMIFRHTRELLKQYKKEGKFSGKIADRNPTKQQIDLQGDDDDPRSERGLYKQIDLYVREYYAKYNSIRKGMGFLMETYRKRLTSSLYAIKRSLEKRHLRLKQALETGDYGILFKELEEEDYMDIPDYILDGLIDELGVGQQSFSTHRSVLHHIIEKEYEYLDEFIASLQSLPYDTKADHLDRLLADIFGKGKRQIIIFSQFKDTVDFLLDYFKPKYGTRLGSYTGQGGQYWDGHQWIMCSKQDIQRKFADPSDRMDLLICTDAASEGLNLQTCDTMINYDIPWNPMRIEQRIGRIDRIGQQSPIVDIYTLFYRDSVEEKAYNRCLQRINFFKSALGHLQPILQATEQAIRDAALASSVEEENKIFERMQTEFEETIAQTEENLRIERLLNHYTPQLPMMTSRAPITQHELEEILQPYIESQGWKKEGELWKKNGKTITFDQTYMDRLGGQTELVTPHSNLSKLIGTLPEIPEVIENDHTIHRIEVTGLTGFVVEKNNRYYIAKNLTELTNPQGTQYSSLTEAKLGLIHLIRAQKIEYLNAEKKAWENRRYNWQVRVKMYLETVAKWRWNTATKIEGIFEFSKEALFREWNNYLQSPERENLRQLADIINYKPSFNPAERTKGRPSKRSPRDSRKEQLFLDDLVRITKRLHIIHEQLEHFMET